MKKVKFSYVVAEKHRFHDWISIPYLLSRWKIIPGFKMMLSTHANLLNRKKIPAFPKKRNPPQFLWSRSQCIQRHSTVDPTIYCSHTRLSNKIKFHRIKWEHIEELTLIEASLYNTQELFRGKDFRVWGKWGNRKDAPSDYLEARSLRDL